MHEIKQSKSFFWGGWVDFIFCKRQVHRMTKNTALTSIKVKRTSHTDLYQRRTHFRQIQLKLADPPTMSVHKPAYYLEHI